MTKKDYILIAKQLKDKVEDWKEAMDNNRDESVSEDNNSELLTLMELINDLSSALKSDNEKFDELRFWGACGLENVCQFCYQFYDDVGHCNCTNPN